MFSSTYPVLADQAFSGRTALRNGVLAIAGSLALWLSAKLQVPFYPVPMTMQTFVVLVIGTAFGWRLGAATIALYLAEGALGLPVFAGTPEKGIGLAYMAGPTGGYLLGYLPAAALCGFLAKRGWDRRIVTMALSMLLGTVVIYAFGLSWLGAVLGWDKPILAWGLTPFILGDLLKLALAAAVLPLAWKFAGHLDR
ncbi:biotin transporter BioY [Mesorhizobium sp. M9A.F.Ca.ET.002.03.1.2]|uniref:biotin transporter BioY n=1 Tax=Mesorhizobium sp. M9A.F.Ca.ET.002.03.1.2 TaxID=2493668 RepID=UPI000F75DE2A|nr:biotin transporter BioY [Mesorhizobium sp. M9A.F.Ca.ET.002.03.1.2]AZO00833.1 biotin transporter BioY [Mesorhizobium sp. M9A.F.Ca.ET.002.03.1.2]